MLPMLTNSTSLRLPKFLLLRSLPRAGWEVRLPRSEHVWSHGGARHVVISTDAFPLQRGTSKAGGGWKEAPGSQPLPAISHGCSLAGVPWVPGLHPKCLAILPPRRANDGFDPKQAEVSGRVPINFSEVWVSAKNDYCQEQMLFLLAFTM